MTMTSFAGRSTRIVLLGLGAINRRVAALLGSRNSAAKIVGIVARTAPSLPKELEGIPWISNAAELSALAPNIVLEAASRDAVREWGETVLRTARRFVVSSSSAFVDDELLRQLRATAEQSGSQLVLSPGALAGMDALSAAAKLPMREVSHRIVKPPHSWGAAVGHDVPSSREEPRVLFYGSAREAANRYPLNANVTVVSSLSGVGLDATTVELVADPAAMANRHEIRATGDFGSLTILLENRPLQSNPKSSELAALALVRIAENELAGLVL